MFALPKMFQNEIIMMGENISTSQPEDSLRYTVLELLVVIGIAFQCSLRLCFYYDWLFDLTTQQNNKGVDAPMNRLSGKLWFTADEADEM